MSDFFTAFFLVVGALFLLLAALGVLRMPDLFTRLSAQTKAVALGSGSMFMAVLVHFDDVTTDTRAIAGIAFFLVTAPVAGHVIARAAYRLGLPLWEGTVIDEMAPHEERRKAAAAAGQASRDAEQASSTTEEPGGSP
ncbi:MAG: monovalent cation/H(+) antiporter subunit G [Dehalococcoidia bacterium]